MQISVDADCGNAPKMRLLRDVTVAYAEQNKNFLLSCMADNIEWTRIGALRVVVTGIRQYAGALNSEWVIPVQSLRVNSILTHGAQGAVAGSAQLEGNTTVHFCDFYRFTGHSQSAKIASIISHRITANLND